MLQIHMIPARKDNYFWLIQPDDQCRDAYIVDPGDARPVNDHIAQHKLILKAILLTHHHHDHIDGAAELSHNFNIPIYGPQSDLIPQVTDYLVDKDELRLGPVKARIMALPGHTLDHIAYYLQIPGVSPCLFSGDTLFAAGCGRLFDGTAALLYRALQKIATLPDETLIYAGHEYTLANIRFALAIEPGNTDLIARAALETEKRDRGIATLPTQLGLEKRTNPFLRCHLKSVRDSVARLSGKKLVSDTDVFTNLRLIKDSF